MPHLTLTGGESATALASGTELLGTGAYNLYDGSNIELTEGYTNTSSVKIEPIIITVTIDGGGGTTADGKATLVLETEYGIVPDVETLFHWNGHMHVGHGGKYSYDSETGKINGGTITLEWVEVKYEHFVGFNTVDAVLETPDYERYLFRDNSQTVIAPTVTYLDAINKVLPYWKNQDNKTGTVRQYLPGEQVTEPDGTKFYAVTIRPDAQVLLVSNDKLFEENGMRICISDRPTWWTLEDGTRVVSWNTQSDGKGTAYAPNTEIDLSGRTTPLVLYAQWQQEGKATVYLDNVFYREADTNAIFEFPPQEPLAGCTFAGWSGVWYQGQKIGGRLEAALTEDGKWTIVIPTGATEVWMNSEQRFSQPFTIDGKSYQPGENKRFFSGDGWRLSCSSDGSVTLTLTNYDGGAINIPTAELAVWLWGKNYINGSTNGPALCGAGELVLCAELRPRPKFAQRADHHGRQRTERHLGEADQTGCAYQAEWRRGCNGGERRSRGREFVHVLYVHEGRRRVDR